MIEKPRFQPAASERLLDEVEQRSLDRMVEWRAEFSELAEIDPVAQELYQSAMETAWYLNAQRLESVSDHEPARPESKVLELLSHSFPEIAASKESLDEVNQRRRAAALVVRQAQELFAQTDGNQLPTNQLKQEALEVVLGIPLTEAQRFLLTEIRAWRTTTPEVTNQKLKLLESSLLPAMSVWQELVQRAEIPASIADAMELIGHWAELQQVVSRLDSLMTAHRRLPKKERLAVDDQKLVWAAVLHDVCISTTDTGSVTAIPATLLEDIAEGRWSGDDPWFAGEGIIHSFQELQEVLTEKKPRLSKQQKKLVTYFVMSLLGLLASGIILQHRDSFIEIINDFQTVDVIVNEVHSESAVADRVDLDSESAGGSDTPGGAQPTAIDMALDFDLTDELSAGGAGAPSEIQPRNSGDINQETVRRDEWEIIRGPVPGGFWKEAEAFDFNPDTQKWRIFRGEIQEIQLLSSHEMATTVLRRVLPITSRSLILSVPPGFEVVSLSTTGVGSGRTLPAYRTESGTIILAVPDGLDATNIGVTYGIARISPQTVEIVGGGGDGEGSTNDRSYLDHTSPALIETQHLLGPDLNALPADAVVLLESLRDERFTDRQRVEAIFNYLNTNYLYSLDTSFNQYYFSGEQPTGLAMMHPTSGRRLDCDGFQTVGIGLLRELGIPAGMEYGYANAPISSAGVAVEGQGDVRVLGTFERHGWTVYYDSERQAWLLFDFTGSNMDEYTQRLLGGFGFLADEPIEVGVYDPYNVSPRTGGRLDETETNFEVETEVSGPRIPPSGTNLEKEWPAANGFGFTGNLPVQGVDIQIPEMREIPTGANWTIQGLIPIEPFVEDTFARLRWHSLQIGGMYTGSWRHFTADHNAAEAETVVTSTFSIYPGEIQFLPIPRGYDVVSVSINTGEAEFGAYSDADGSLVLQYDRGEPATISYGLRRSSDTNPQDLEEYERENYTYGTEMFYYWTGLGAAPPFVQEFLGQINAAEMSNSEKVSAVFGWLQENFVLTLDPRYNDTYFNNEANPSSFRVRPELRMMELRLLSPDLANVLGTWMLQQVGVPARPSFGYRTSPVFSMGETTLDAAQYGVMAEWFDQDSLSWQTLDLTLNRVDESTYTQLSELNGADAVEAIITRTEMNQLLHELQLTLTSAGDWWDGHNGEVRNAAILAWFLSTLGAGTAYFFISRLLLKGTQKKLQQRVTLIGREEWRNNVTQLTGDGGELRTTFLAGAKDDDSRAEILAKVAFWMTGVPSGVSAWRQLRTLRRVDTARVDQATLPSAISGFYEQALGMEPEQAAFTALEQNMKFLAGGLCGDPVDGNRVQRKITVDNEEHPNRQIYRSMFALLRAQVAEAMGLDFLDQLAFGNDRDTSILAVFKLCRQSPDAITFIDQVAELAWTEYQYYCRHYQTKGEILDETEFFEAFLVASSLLETYWHLFHEYSQLKK